MNTARDLLSQIERAGAAHFSSTSLAAGHGAVTRKVRRHRVGRAAVTSVASVGIVGAGAWGAMNTFTGDATVTPGASASDAPAAVTPDANAPSCANAALLITNPAPDAYPNGELPAEVLCAVASPIDSFFTITLRADAGVALEAVFAAAVDQGLAMPGFYEGYRDLAAQESASARRGDMVSAPGTSPHGTGLALDLSIPDNGDSTYADDPKYAAFVLVSAEFGWAAPDANQPWHFEFTPEGTGAVVDLATFPEGRTIDHIAGTLADAYGATPEEATAALEASVRELIPEATTAEGWPVPGTFSLSGVSTLRDAADVMVEARVQQLTDLGVPREDWQTVITKASLVEREAKRAEDKAKVARVIENRVAAGMRLELDSTIRFIAPGETVFTSAEQRAVESPYNTYTNVGLPPGAIATPSLESIQAVVAPAEGDWLFFVTVDLLTGETRFASTFEEHQANVQILQEWIAANG